MSIVPIHALVFKDTYETLKKEAEERKNTTKEFVNDMLMNILSKLDYLRKIAPELSVDSYENDRIILRDSKLRMLIDVFEKNNEFYCEHDKRTDCIHSKYVRSSPEVEFDLFLHSKHAIKAKKAEYDREMTANVNHHHHHHINQLNRKIDQ